MTDLLDRLQEALAGRYQSSASSGAAAWRRSISRRISSTAGGRAQGAAPGALGQLGPERFLREIKIAARLNHPHILPLYRFGRGRRLPLLRDAVRRGRVAARAARPRAPARRSTKRCSIARRSRRALDYAHRQRIVHRDIKPENVMLHEGEAMVTDFGIAKAVSAAGGENSDADRHRRSARRRT